MTPSARTHRPLPPDLPRFARAERLVHRSIAVLMVICLVTAAILYLEPLSIVIGHRRLVLWTHVYAGLALPVPLVLGLVSAAYRLDLGRLNRFSVADRHWLRGRKHRDGPETVGKFNAGQKLNACLSAGAMLVLVGTGILMYFTHLVGLSYRIGASFVHDWFALGLGLLVLGHIRFALRDPEARRGMRDGVVSPEWAWRHHRGWAHEFAAGAERPDQVEAERSAE